MSIWISKTCAALSLLGLAACADLSLAPPSTAVSVLGGAVKVAPPPGYCANPDASKDSGDSAVVLMGRCSATSKSQPALITASIGAAGSGRALDAGPVALTSFFTSDAGRSMLASSGKASGAVVQASQTEAAAVLLLVNDSDLGAYWRAILALKGRLVMLSATGAENVTLAPQDGRVLLSKALSALRRANGEAAKAGGKLEGLFKAPSAAPAPNAAPADAAATAAAPAKGALHPAPRPRVPTSG